MKNISIIGVGKYLPERIVKNTDLEKMVETTDEWIKTKIGIAERRIATWETVTDMAVRAGKAAIEDAGINADDIDIVICSSISYDKRIPTLSNYVAEELGIEDAMCLDVNAGGCSNYIACLTTAISHMSYGQDKTVLCVTADRNSDFLNWKDRGTCVIFGDGAAATVLQNSGSGKVDYMKMAGKRMDALVLPTAQVVGYDDTFLKMDGRQIFSFATTKGAECILDGCEELGIKADDIDFFIFHQANINIIKTIMNKLEVDMSKTHILVDKYGNTTCSSVGMALEEAVHANKIKKGDKVALVAFGGGLNWGIIVLEW